MYGFGYHRIMQRPVHMWPAAREVTRTWERVTDRPAGFMAYVSTSSMCPYGR